MDNRYQVKLENLFEGPMDLLIHLIKKNELDIYDIPIALITDQYLAYLGWMQSMNIDFAGDFLLMASTLAQIKSKMLLPVHNEEEEEDPRLELARPLAEYIRMKSVAEQLGERDLLGEHIFTRHINKKEYVEDNREDFIKVGLFELIDAFQKILENLNPEQRVAIKTEKISVKDKITQIAELLEEKHTVTFGELFFDEITKSDVIVTFLALLEMVKLGLIKIMQHVQSGIIRLVYI
jgi:segregation and condensation protein A